MTDNSERSTAPAPDPQTGDRAVLRMRDEFAQLAKCYIDMGDYKAAREASAMAQALESFEDQNIITGIEWPARIERDPDGLTWLAGNKDTSYER